MLAHADRLAVAEDRLTRMEKGLRDLVEKEIRTALDNLRRPNLDGPTLTQEIGNLQEIRAGLGTDAVRGSAGQQLSLGGTSS